MRRLSKHEFYEAGIVRSEAKPVKAINLAVFNEANKSHSNYFDWPVYPSNLFQPKTCLNQSFSAFNNRFFHKSTSPVPEFAKEYIIDPAPTKKVLKKSKLYSKSSSKSKIPQTPTSKKSKVLIPKQNSKSAIVSDKKEPSLHKILRLFRPQIQSFVHKSKIQVFSTVSPKVKKSKAKLLDYEKSFKKLKPKKKEKKVPLNLNSIEPITSFNDYSKPAFTFGEKLWRLNEISIFNIENKQTM